MDTNLRTLAKTATWQTSGLLAMCGITYAGGIVAIIGAATGTLTYMLHERLWSRVRWGQLNGVRQ